MLFPDKLQTAILFDRRISCLDEIVRTFLRVEQARSGAEFNAPEVKQGIYYHLFGGNQLNIIIEYVDRPADVAILQTALASTVTGLLCPDMRERVARCKSHILINVSHGVLSDVRQNADIAAFLDKLAIPAEGHSLAHFMQRLDILGLLCRVACDTVAAQAVHWVQSNQLIAGEQFETLAKSPVPNMLHVHPHLFGKRQSPGEKPEVGILTFGARHFIGREIVIEPSVLPWAANFDTMLAVLKVATMDNGYIIPHGDSFGPEDRSLSYRVLHRDADSDRVPTLELVPLLYREYGFQSADFVPFERVFDDRVPPPSLMPTDEDEKQQLANEWREKRSLAEGIGGRFEVRARGGSSVPPAPTRRNPAERILGFGRKRT